jgi:hypothetical protein
VINLNETPEEINTLAFGQSALVNGIEMILVGAENGLTSLITKDSRHQLFSQLVRGHIVVNDGELVIYKNFVKHLRYNDDMDEHSPGRSLMTRSQLCELLKSATFRIG